jgi:hypothetical protein
VFVVTDTVTVFVQPLFGFVTVKVYVPVAVTFVVAVVAELLHKYVTPVVVLLPVSVTLVFVQVNCAGGVIDTLGKAPLLVTATVAVFVQPLLG